MRTTRITQMSATDGAHDGSSSSSSTSSVASVGLPFMQQRGSLATGARMLAAKYGIMDTPHQDAIMVGGAL
jgi:hypothetical protein